MDREGRYHHSTMIHKEIEMDILIHIHACLYACWKLRVQRDGPKLYLEQRDPSRSETLYILAEP